MPCISIRTIKKVMQPSISVHTTDSCSPLLELICNLQVVLEGKLVNLDVTSPAATLALGLMFLRTNDPAIAAAFALPDTHFALDYVRPDFIMLRTLARSLVVQDSVTPTQAWIESQLPPLIKVPLLHSKIASDGVVSAQHMV